MNQVPPPRPTFNHHHTKFSRLGHLTHCIYVRLMSALRVGQVCDVISPSFIAACWTPSRYVASLSYSVKVSPDRSPVRPKPVYLSVPFCQPFVILRHSTWLFTFVKYSCRDHRITAALFGEAKFSFYELCLASSVLRLHVLCATLRETDSTAVLFCGSTEGRRGDWRQ